jgi:acyl transferase domain-containing protein
LAQKNLLLKAWEKAGINPETITYIETHGTGTRLGDPIEFSGLTQAFKQHTDKKHFCAIGSSKTNIGTWQTVELVLRVHKTVLSLHHKQIPPSLHFKQPNRLINFEDTAAYVNTVLKPWETDGIPRRAGVSAFGLVGTNIHVVVEETQNGYVKGEPTGTDQLLCLSAKSDSLLTGLVDRYIEYFRPLQQFCN